MRKRYIEPLINKAMGFSPLVGVLGHRQVGKTTLLEKFCKSFYTCDKTSIKTEALSNPEKFIKDRAGQWVGLDECQLIPELFPELKDWVRTHPKPGQFLLSGSVRFTSKEAINESLTGRITNLELLPFTLSEIEGKPLNTFILEYMKTQNAEGFSKNLRFDLSALKKTNLLVNKYYEYGGLPGVCFIRDKKIRSQKIKDQLQTLLDRDVRLVKKIALSYNDILATLKSIANQQGKPLRIETLQKETGVSVPSIKKLLFCFEALYLIRNLPIEGGMKGNSVFFEDHAEWNHLLDHQSDSIDQLNHFTYLTTRAPFHYQIGEVAQFFQYRTRGGALIPICIRTKEGVLGIVPILNLKNKDQISGSINSFLKNYLNGKILIIHPNFDPPHASHPRVLSVPLTFIV